MMSTATPSARKRKRSPSEDRQPDLLSIELSSLPDTQVGPVLGVCVVIFKSVSRSPLIRLAPITQRASHSLHLLKILPLTSS